MAFRIRIGYEAMELGDEEWNLLCKEQGMTKDGVIELSMKFLVRYIRITSLYEYRLRSILAFGIFSQ